MDFSDIINQSQGLLDRAEAALKKKLDTQPEDGDTLYLLINNLRQQGKCKEAAKVCQQFLELTPGNLEVEYLMNILEQKRGIPPTTGAHPSPFYQIKNFLSKDHQQKITDFTRRSRQLFDQASTFNEERGYRDAQVVYDEELADISPHFLKEVKEAFETSPIARDHDVDGRPEIQLVRHGDGGHYKVHQDTAQNGRLARRAITYVYHLDNPERSFEGGDLLLFDTDIEQFHCNSRFTRLTSPPNSVTFFPSRYFHQVCPIRLRGKDFMNARFTLNGWLHTSK